MLNVEHVGWSTKKTSTMVINKVEKHEENDFANTTFQQGWQIKKE